MHETAVARDILNMVLEHAARLDARPVALTVSCGTLNILNEEILRFAFSAAAEGTAAAGAVVNVRIIPLQIRCRSCRATSGYDIQRPGCPSCGSEEIEFLPDAPIMLENIEFEEPAT